MQPLLINSLSARRRNFKNFFAEPLINTNKREYLTTDYRITRIFCVYHEDWKGLKKSFDRIYKIDRDF